MDEIIRHLAEFVSDLWQIHVFAEGNTGTTAVFFIKYLRALGFDATNDIFAENAWRTPGIFGTRWAGRITAT